jgi:hypothetical protein
VSDIAAFLREVADFLERSEHSHPAP